MQIFIKSNYLVTQLGKSIRHTKQVLYLNSLIKFEPYDTQFVYVTKFMNHITYTYYNKRYILCLDHLYFCCCL